MKKLIFFLDQHGRALTQKSMNRQLSELFSIMGIRNVEAIALTGLSINKPDILHIQIANRNLDEWELMYLHDGENKILMNPDNKKELVCMLPAFQGSSAEAVYNILKKGGACKNAQL